MRPVNVAPIAIGEMRGDEAVDRLALGRHGAALRVGDLLRHLAQAADLALLEPALAEA